MPIDKDLLTELHLNPEYRRLFADWIERWPLFRRTRILIVVDTEISTSPVDYFGLSRVIELIRGAAVGCLRFTVDIALRNGEAPSVVTSPGPYQPRYRGFRFDMQTGGSAVIDRYDQVWCFGFKPSNSGNLDDAEIDLPFAFPAGDAELAVLAHWMDTRQGGLFGTGDHHFLGASMCRRIPRLGTMRRWTNADGVPPIGTPARIDTLRPPSAAFEPGAPGGPADLGNSSHQGDLVVQPIHWVPAQYSFWPFAFRKRPHPVLCHPELGPIDVMPDHAHEGLCVETAAIPASDTYDFDGAGPRPVYPPSTTGGPQPLPKIIAYGSTLGDPPYNFAKGPQPARARFPMISVYDGHQAGVGRVATDSTWHHWMDVNINVISAANTIDWQKISRYYINLAVWLNPPGISTNCLWLSVAASHFQDVGMQEYVKQAAVTELGAALRQHLIVKYGPCWVTERIWEIIWQRKLWPWETLRDFEPQTDWLRAAPEPIEELVLGHLVKATREAALTLQAAADDAGTRVKALPAPEELFAEAIPAAMREFGEALADDFARGSKLTRELRR